VCVCVQVKSLEQKMQNRTMISQNNRIKEVCMCVYLCTCVYIVIVCVYIYVCVFVCVCVIDYGSRQSH